jgi:dolichol-phosphate mannosyltransferase
MQALGEPYELLFVDDGSTDGSRRILEQLRAQDEHIGILSFSRNFGHQIAITAGMEHARGQAVVVIDADLQDPPELISQLVARWREGYEVVYAQRLERRGESTFKRWSAALFYRLLRRVTDVPVPMDTGDFRLIDRKVCDALLRMPERHRFVRGLVAWLGFRQTAVQFVRDVRLAGQTKYSLRKMLSLASDGILAFSDRPLRVTGYAGLLIATAGFATLVALASAAWLGGHAPLWLIVLAALGMLHGATLLALGVVGAYLLRIYDEVRGRPLYVLESDLPPGKREGLER